MQVEPVGSSTRPSDTSGGVDAVDRALAIPATFSVGRERRTLARLAAATGLYKSTIPRLRRSLEHGGFLHRGSDGMLAVGPQPLRLSAIHRLGPGQESMVRPVPRTPAAETGESASLCRREGDRRICLFREESERSVRDHVGEGDLRPLDRGGAGHVPIRTVNARHASATGVVASHDEGDPDVAAPAAVFDHDGSAGALTVSGAATNVAAITPLLMKSARALTRSLGGVW